MLVPSNAQNRTSGISSAVPPYHPSYLPPPPNDPQLDKGEEDDDDAGSGSSPSRSSFSSNEDFNPKDIDYESPLATRVRRGSEGWEVRPFSFDIQEGTRQRHPVGNGPQNQNGSEDERDDDPWSMPPDQYKRYVPEPSTSEEEEEEDAVPLGLRRKEKDQ